MTIVMLANPDDCHCCWEPDAACDMVIECGNASWPGSVNVQLSDCLDYPCRDGEFRYGVVWRHGVMGGSHAAHGVVWGLDVLPAHMRCGFGSSCGYTWGAADPDPAARPDATDPYGDWVAWIASTGYFHLMTATIEDLNDPSRTGIVDFYGKCVSLYVAGHGGRVVMQVRSVTQGLPDVDTGEILCGHTSRPSLAGCPTCGGPPGIVNWPTCIDYGSYHDLCLAGPGMIYGDYPVYTGDGDGYDWGTLSV